MPLTRDRDAVRAALAEMQGEGRTSLRDAAFSALALRETDPGRTLLLLFSDGADTSSWLSVENVTRVAERTDVVIYPVGMRHDQAGPFLETLAKATGGRVMLAGGDADLHATFVRTLGEFRDRYVLSYQPTGLPVPGWHQIQVTLKGRGGKVTARRGYFVQ